MNLTEDERWLLMGLTDFNKSLTELVTDVHFDNVTKSASEKYAIAENLVISLIDKGLIQLSKSKYKKDSGNVICLLKLTFVTSTVIDSSKCV